LGIGALWQVRHFLVNDDLTQTRGGWLICVYPATAQELLVISHRSAAKRRFLAIGFFEIDSRARRLICIGRRRASIP
jgi:hypothetical protein